MRIDLDTELKPESIKIGKKEHSYDADSLSANEFIESLSDKKSDYKYAPDHTCVETESQSLFPYTTKLPSEIHHKNLLCSIELAYGTHRGIVITPDAIWYTLLQEITSIIKADPEFHRALFTTSSEKKEIFFHSSPNIDLRELVKVMKDFVPSDIGRFLPEFSTSTEDSQIAFMASFADAMSPYYNYGMLCCGIPFIELEGTSEDWIKVKNGWNSLTECLSPKHSKFYGRVYDILGQIVAAQANPSQSIAFWKEMFTTERCGSGSDVDINGWFSELFREKPKHSPKRAGNFPTHVASLEAKYMPTGVMYHGRYGIFCSDDDGTKLTPQFGKVIFEKREPQITLRSYDSKGKLIPNESKTPVAVEV